VTLLFINLLSSLRESKQSLLLRPFKKEREAFHQSLLRVEEEDYN